MLKERKGYKFEMVKKNMTGDLENEVIFECREKPKKGNIRDFGEGLGKGLLI